MIDAGQWDASRVKYAVFADDTDFWPCICETVKASMPEFNGELVYEDYTAINVTDFYTSITKMKESGADIAFVQLTNPAAGAAFIKQGEKNPICRPFRLQIVLQRRLTGMSWLGMLQPVHWCAAPN